MDDASITDLLRHARTIAVVGMKDDRDPHAAAFAVPRKLRSLGYDVTPVNPTIGASLGKASLPDLASLEEAPDIISVFRRTEVLPALADEILALAPDRRPKAVWFQTGIRHDPTAERLRAAGMQVVQDECIGVSASMRGGPA